ncbi:MAG: LON peptidase substrate-binding domain-containing protein [Thiohalobacterales bacterium]|nr:LON peptidase substrate-binding domain-containing protein [Thiohalobacterales bacterium]
MNSNPFIVPFARLPVTLPVFPLTGAVLMPGNELPLNIFEPRYLNMTGDAMSGDRLIGMIQPDADDAQGNGLCKTGCAGRITQYRETRDGRLEIVLTGVCRFDIAEELSSVRGYRLIVPDWSRFHDDYADNENTLHSEHDLLIHTLKEYFAAKQLEVDWTALEQLPVVKLMDSLGMALPLSGPDKQVLLESVEPEERLRTFIAVLRSAIDAPGTASRH